MWFEHNLVHLILLKVSQRRCKALIYLWNYDVDEALKLLLISQKDLQSFGEYTSNRTSTKLNVQVLIVGRISVNGKMFSVKPFRRMSVRLQVKKGDSRLRFN